MNKLSRTASALFVALVLSAGAAATGGPPLPLDPVRAAASHVEVVRMSSGWVRANDEFGSTFTDSLHENLRRCARGPERLDMTVHVTRVKRANRIASLVRGHGSHRLAATAELIDPQTKGVLGRYPIEVIVDAGGPAAIALADRQLMVSDAFATELCRQAFRR